MRVLLACFAFWCLTGCQPAKEWATDQAGEGPVLDSVDAEPDISKVEFENDRVRIIRTRRPAGHPGTRHTHGRGVYVVLSDSTSLVTSESDRREIRAKAGDIGNTLDGARLGGRYPVESRSSRPSTIPHSTQNVGTTMSEAVMVELKVEAGTPLDAPSHDAVEVDPLHHTIEFENELVRVVRTRYPEGYETPPHGHYPGVLVQLADFRWASGPEGEDAELVEGTAGSAYWVDAGQPHLTKNHGGEVHLVRVGIKVR